LSAIAKRQLSHLRRAVFIRLIKTQASRPLTKCGSRPKVPVSNPDKSNGARNRGGSHVEDFRLRPSDDADEPLRRVCSKALRFVSQKPACRLRLARGGYPVRRRSRLRSRGVGVRDRKAGESMSVTEPRRIARRREPMFDAPLVVLGLIAVLIAIQAVLNWAPDAIQDGVVRDFAFVPGRLTISIWPRRLIELLQRANSDPAALQQARQIRALGILGGGAKPWTLLTYAFLHGSWTHVLLNSVWLVAFGPPIARRFGSGRFILFIIVTAVFSALAHWASAPMDFSPLIGASGADSGLMGAATRFMFQPGAPLGPSAPIGRPEIETIPAASLRGIFADRRAMIFLVIWLVTNLIFGAGAQSLGFSDAPVAWIAHLGGFFSGLLLFPLFDRPFRPPPMAGELAPDPRPGNVSV
jgi:membrane associated rhomboid family serine protease